MTWPAFTDLPTEYQTDKEVLQLVIINKKTCTRCNIEKPLNDFYRTVRQKDGHQSWCKACQSNWRKEYLNRRIRQLRNYKELGGKCERCEYSGMALSFHHLTFEKDHDLWSASDNLEKLIKNGKISLLCRNCHAEIHYGFNCWTKIFNNDWYDYINNHFQPDSEVRELIGELRYESDDP